MAFEGDACSSACGWCGMCTPSWPTGGESDPMIRAENWPEPIPDLALRVAIEKERRQQERDETYQRAVRREFGKPSAA